MDRLVLAWMLLMKLSSIYLPSSGQSVSDKITHAEDEVNTILTPVILCYIRTLDVLYTIVILFILSIYLFFKNTFNLCLLLITESLVKFVNITNA